MKGLVLYKINSNTVIKEFLGFCKEFNIPNYCLIGISSHECLPAVNYVLKNKDFVNVYFFKSLDEFFTTINPKSIGTLSKSFGYTGTTDWLLIGYLDKIEIDEFNINVIKFESNLDIIGSTLKFLFENHGRRRI